MALTSSLQNAINALASRGGTGVFDRNNVLLCAGERLGFMRSTWSRLKAKGIVTIEGRRVTLTEPGRGMVTSMTPSEDHIAIDDR